MRFYAWLKFLSFLHEALFALGAGNGDPALSPGNPDNLTAFGAIVIAVIPVLQAVKKLEEFPVFLITLVGIAGEAAVQRPEHQSVGNRGQQQIHLYRVCKCTDKANHKACRKDRHIQFIGAVTANHEITKSKRKPLEELSNHKDITLQLVFFLHYIAIWQNFNNYPAMFTDCLTFL